MTEATLEPDASRLDSRARARRLALAVLALALPTAVIAASTRLWRAPAGLAFAATSEPTAGGVTEDARPLDATALRELRSGTYTVVWHGYWLPADAGTYRVVVRSAAPFEMRVAGRTLRGGGPGSLAAESDVVLKPGPNAIDLRLTGARRGTRLRVTRAVEGTPQGPFDKSELWPRQPGRLAALLSRVGPQVEAGAGLVAAVALVGLFWPERRRALAWLGRPLRLRPSPRLAWALGLVVVLYAGALRVEALIVRYGKEDLPAWARRLEAPLRELHPARLRWKPVERRYVGDPGAYLRHARETEGFYDPRFREPFFVYSAKLGVALSGGRDIGISLASAAFSTLAVAATFLLGARAVSPWVGLLASLGFALDQHVIALSPEGWRDDAFAFLCAGFAWAALGLYDRGRFRDALILGLFGGFACLTRVTSLSFVVVALGVLALVPRSREWRVRGERVAVAGVVCAALIVPFLLSCWIAWGDPLVSINGVAPAYQAASGLRDGNEMGVMEYLAARFRAWELLDTVVVGATAYPFARKWNFDYVSPYASGLLAAASAVGMLLMAVIPRTRLLVALFVAALVPFTLTWNVKGGSAWRLTLFAYPFYLVAGAFVLWSLARLAADAAERGRFRRTIGERSTWVRLGVVSGAACLVALGSLTLPYQRARETLGRAQPARVTVGPRDRLFFGPGWQSPACNKNVCARYTSGSQSWIHLPLPPGRDYTLRLRAQPMALPGMRPQRLTLLGNGTPIGDLALPESKLAGLYEARWPSSAVKDGQNRLEIRAAYAVEVAKAGATDPLARPGTRTAFSLQYLDIAPTGQASGPAVRRRQGRGRRGSSDKPRESSRPTAPS